MTLTERLERTYTGAEIKVDLAGTASQQTYTNNRLF